MNKYAEMMSDERQRQITEEKHTHENDDKLHDGELGDLASCYAFGGYSLATIIDYDEHDKPVYGRKIWPWGNFNFNYKHDRKRQLIIAGALIIAELERLERLENKDV